MSTKLETAGGTLHSCNDNIVEVEIKPDAIVVQGEIAYIQLPNPETDDNSVIELMCEVLEVRQDSCVMQVFEPSDDLYFGLPVRFTGIPLSVSVGPGMLGNVFDGLQNPLEQIAGIGGDYLQRGVYVPPLNLELKWEFTPNVNVGDTVIAGQKIGFVPEKHLQHKVMVPFHLAGTWTVKSIVSPGGYTVQEIVAQLSDESGQTVDITMCQQMVAKQANTTYLKRLPIQKHLITSVRTIDAMSPIPMGGSASMPGAFGTGKSVLAQALAANSDTDIVIVLACGERAGEVIEVLEEFPKITDPRTGGRLSDRTVMVCNTSSMPTAAREASVFVGCTLGEFYRNMGLNVLILADSTSRWAQGLREAVSARQQIPGQRGFPADLEQLIQRFYARSNRVQTVNNDEGSLTIVGTVSPAGGDFNDPVVLATSPCNQAFWALSQQRADERRYPAIDPLQSWTKIEGSVPKQKRDQFLELLREAEETRQLMAISGEEGVSLDAYVRYWLAELFDACFLQQDSFNPVDAACSTERQQLLFAELYGLCFETELHFEPVVGAEPQTAQEVMQDWARKLIQVIRSWNSADWQDEAGTSLWKEVQQTINMHASERST